MCPFRVNKEIPEESVPPEMKNYLTHTGRPCSQNRKLVGTLSAKKMLVYVPLLLWYIKHGVQVKLVYLTIDYL